MNYIKNTILTVAITSLFFMLPVKATPLLDVQQEKLHAIAPTWTTTHIPNGMPQVNRQSNLRTSGTTGASMLVRNVYFIFTDDIGFDIKTLSASFEPLRPEEPVNLDDPRQFIIRIHSGEVILPPKAISALFNKQILAYWPRPLNNMRFITHNNSLVVETGLKLWSWFPFVWLPARLEGNIILDQKNQLVYTPRDVRVLGIPMAGLLRTFGIKLTTLLTLNREGANLVGNSIILNHKKVFPPPALTGNIASACLEEAGLRLTFNDSVPASEFSPPATAGRSFIWIQSGDVKLFDTLVTNANILIKDENMNCNMNFNLYDYRCLIAEKNEIKLSEDGTLVVTLSTVKAPCSQSFAFYRRR